MHDFKWIIFVISVMFLKSAGKPALAVDELHQINSFFIMCFFPNFFDYINKLSLNLKFFVNQVKCKNK